MQDSMVGNSFILVVSHPGLLFAFALYSTVAIRLPLAPNDRALARIGTQSEATYIASQMA
jgi:hypothetical protein